MRIGGEIYLMPLEAEMTSSSVMLLMLLALLA